MDKMSLEFGHVNNILRFFEKLDAIEPVDFIETMEAFYTDAMKVKTTQLFDYEINSFDLSKMLFTFAKEILEDDIQFGFIKEQHALHNMIIATVDLKKATAKIGDRTLSGLIINPYPGNKKPIFLYMHGTRLKKSPMPSSLCNSLNEFAEDLIELIGFKWTMDELIHLIVELFEKGSKLLDYIEEIFLIMIAVLKGCIVIMPDYPGMGDDVKSELPYVVAKNMQHDLCNFSESVINNQTLIDKVNDWNNDLNVGGYSQGGYVAMVVTAGLIERGNLRDNIKNSWPASGPYSLSEVMRRIMISKEKYFSLSFVPLTIRAYYECCGKKEFLSPVNVFGKDGQKIFDIVNESINYKESDNKLKEYTNGEMIPSLLLTSHFKKMLEDDNSEVTKLLKKNDAFQSCPEKLSDITTLFHHKNDKVVPYANAEIASMELNVDIIDLKLMFLDDIIENKHILGFISYIAKVRYI